MKVRFPKDNRGLVRKVALKKGLQKSGWPPSRLERPEKKRGRTRKEADGEKRKRKIDVDEQT